MFAKTYARMYAWLNNKTQAIKNKAENGTEKYGLRLIKFNGLVSIILILSPLPYDGVMNIGVAGLLFLGENFIEKHFNVTKSWKFAYYASQFLLITSMVLGLPFGINKGFSPLVIIGSITLVSASLFTTGFLCYAFKKKCREERDFVASNQKTSNSLSA